MVFEKCKGSLSGASACASGSKYGQEESKESCEKDILREKT